MITTDYSDCIITIPLATQRQLVPTFTDGVDAVASVAKFNQLFLSSIEGEFDGAWVNQELRQGYEVCSPDAERWEAREKMVISNLMECWKAVYDGGDWYVS